MIRITQQDSSKDAKRYYATADYYSEGQELVGSWGGKGAARLGLEGTDDKFSFERLCDNLDPRTGEPWDDKEDRWKAGQFRELKRDAPYFQAAFRVRLAGKLQDLGFGVARKRDDFEIAGIPADVLKRFSRRTALIEKLAAELGISDPDRKGELGAETREKKGKALSWDALRKEWNARLGEDERDGLARVHRRETAASKPQPGHEQAVEYAIDHSFTREAAIPERKLLTEVLKRGIGEVTVESAARELQARPLIRREVAGRAMVTTNEMLSLESRMVEFARQGRGRCRPLGDPERPCSREWFNEGQKAAVHHILGSRDRVMIIRGAAGTGKTTLEQEIGEALAEAGKPVVAIAQSVTASREVLRNEAGFPKADTVAQFLKDQDMQKSAKDGVILVDEASQLGTRDMLKVFDTANAVNARVILVGDRRQHRSVTAGEPLKLLEQTAGLHVAQVTEILRQSGDYKKAAKALSEGQTDEAFEELDKLGWIKEVPDGDRNERLAAAYLSASSELKNDGKCKSALVVSPTHAEAARITDAIRAGLKAEGTLGKERIVNAWSPAHLTDAQKTDATQYGAGDLIEFKQNAPGHAKGTRLVVAEGTEIPAGHAARFELYRPTQFALAEGDRLRVTAGGKTKDGKHRLNNGSLLTVQGFTKRGDIIVDHGWVIAGNSEVEARAFSDLDAGAWVDGWDGGRLFPRPAQMREDCGAMGCRGCCPAWAGKAVVAWSRLRDAGPMRSPPAEDVRLRRWLNSSSPSGDGSTRDGGAYHRTLTRERGPGVRHAVVPPAASV